MEGASRHEVLHTDPLVLPGEQKVLFSSLTSEAGTERIEALSMQNGKPAVIIDHATTPIWSPTGHLIFGREGALWAVPLIRQSLGSRSRGPRDSCRCFRRGTQGNTLHVILNWTGELKQVLAAGGVR